MTLSEYSVKKPLSSLIVIGVISLLGIFSINRLPLLFLPEISRPFLSVIVPYRSSSPDDISRLITAPVEGALGGMQNLNSLSSTSSGSSASLRLEFEIGTNMDLATAEIRDRLDQVKPMLPEQVGNIRIRRFQTTDQPILFFNAAWAGDSTELYRIAEDVVGPKVLRIEGVADVDISGIREEEITIDLDASLMDSFGISISQISQSLRSNSVTLSAGSIMDSGRKYLVRSIGEFEKIDDIAALPITGTNVSLGDVADVSYGFPEPSRVQRLNGQESVAFRVYKSSTANVVEVSNRVKDMLKQLANEEELSKLSVRIFFDQAREITRSLDSLRNAGLIGAMLAVVMLFLFMGKIRSTLVIGLSIPISIIFTFAFMYLARRAGIDISLNIISLSGLMLAVGMLVDNSVVVMENIYRHRENGVPKIKAAIQGANEVAMPVFAATLTSIIVFVPLFFTANTSFGRFMRDFGISIVAALVASLFVSLTLIPLVSSRLFSGSIEQKHRFLDFLGKRYTGFMKRSLKHPLVTVLIVGAVFGGAMWLFTKIGREFTPPAPARTMSMTISVPTDYDVYDVRDVFNQIENRLLAQRNELEIETLSSDFRESGGRFTIYFRDIEQSKYTTSELTQASQAVLPEIAGVSMTLGRRWGFGGGQLGVSVDLKGPETKVLGVFADDVSSKLTNVQGLLEIDTNLESGDEELQVLVNRRKARSYGLSSEQVAQSIAISLSDSATATFRAEDREIPIRVKLKAEDQIDMQGLQNLTVDGTSDTIPVGTIIDVTAQPGPTSIRRENGVEILTVSADTDRRGMMTLQNEVTRALSEIDLPPGYSWEIGRSFRQFRQSQATSQFAIILAVIFVYIVIASLFESFAHPITILFSVPFSLIGVAVLFYFTKTTLNTNSWLGIMVLFGVVVNNAIILIDHINRLRKQGMDKLEAILTGGRDRLRPILITAMTTLLGLSPLVAPLLFPGIFGPIEGRANQYGPIALALVGGLTTSTFLTLIITPTIYSIMDDIVRVVRRVIRTAVRGLRAQGEPT